MAFRHQKAPSNLRVREHDSLEEGEVPGPSRTVSSVNPIGFTSISEPQPAPALGWLNPLAGPSKQRSPIKAELPPRPTQAEPTAARRMSPVKRARSPYSNANQGPPPTHNTRREERREVSTKTSTGYRSPSLPYDVSSKSGDRHDISKERDGRDRHGSRRYHEADRYDSRDGHSRSYSREERVRDERDRRYEDREPRDYDRYAGHRDYDREREPYRYIDDRRGNPERNREHDMPFKSSDTYRPSQRARTPSPPPPPPEEKELGELEDTPEKSIGPKIESLTAPIIIKNRPTKKSLNKDIEPPPPPPVDDLPPPPPDARPPSPPAPPPDWQTPQEANGDKPVNKLAANLESPHPKSVPHAPNRNLLQPSTRVSTPNPRSDSNPYETKPKTFTRPTADEELRNMKKTFFGTTTLDSYDVGLKLGEGTFGVVTKGVEISTKRAIALKKLITHNPRDGVSVTTVREIKILKSLDHPNIVPIIDMVVERKIPGDKTNRGEVFMVFPYMDHDLCGLLMNRDFKISHSIAKLFIKQLLEGMAYIHANNFVHRDIKSANILVDKSGAIMIADFGLARSWSNDTWLPPHLANEYTNMVVTRWYRAPELLLGDVHYGPAVDMWSIGCVLGELYNRDPILPGESDRDQLLKIFSRCGAPSAESFPGWDSLPGFPDANDHPWHETPPSTSILELAKSWQMDRPGADLMMKLLTLDPKRRYTAEQALDHPWFWIDPKPAPLGTMQSVESSHEMTTRDRKVPPPPPVNVTRPQPNYQGQKPRQPWGSQRPPFNQNQMPHQGQNFNRQGSAPHFQNQQQPNLYPPPHMGQQPPFNPQMGYQNPHNGGYGVPNQYPHQNHIRPGSLPSGMGHRPMPQSNGRVPAPPFGLAQSNNAPMRNGVPPPPFGLAGRPPPSGPGMKRGGPPYDSDRDPKRRRPDEGMTSLPY